MECQHCTWRLYLLCHGFSSLTSLLPTLHFAPASCWVTAACTRHFPKLRPSPTVGRSTGKPLRPEKRSGAVYPPQLPKPCLFSAPAGACCPGSGSVPSPAENAGSTGIKSPSCLVSSPRLHCPSGEKQRFPSSGLCVLWALRWCEKEQMRF